MLYAAIDIHKHAFQVAVLDPESDEVVDARLSADRECHRYCAEEWHGRVAAVAIEATTGWRWVWRELVSCGFDVRLAEPVQALGAAGQAAEREDRSPRRALAGAVAREGHASGVVDPA